MRSLVERIDRQISDGLEVGNFAFRLEMAGKKNRENAGFFFGTGQLCRTPSFLEIDPLSEAGSVGRANGGENASATPSIYESADNNWRENFEMLKQVASEEASGRSG